MVENHVSEVFILVADLAGALGVQGLNRLPGPWVHKVDGRWTIAANGQREPHEVVPEGCMAVTLEPYQLAVWWNGWLAGVLGPRGGQIAAHPDGANEERLCTDLRAATARAAEERPEV